MNTPVGAKSLLAISTLAVLATALQSAWSQTIPDAGTLRQQIEREKPATPGQLPAPRLNLATPELSLPSGTVITVKEFRFVGNHRIGQPELARALQNYLGRPLDFDQLQMALAAVAQVYRDAGWVAQVNLPKQDVTDGVVTFRIVEAVFSGVKVEGAEASRVSVADVVARIEAQQKVGEPLNTDAIDRALWIVGDLPGVSVTGNLREGTQEGETELVLLLVNKPLVTGEADLDNTGARSTGENRVSVTASLNSPLGIGDQATLNAIHTDGSDYAQLGYSLPVGVRGARANVTLSRLDYRLIGSDFSALNGSGNSNSAGLDLSYPLVREREQNLSIGLGLQNKSFHNDAAGVVQSDYSDILSTVSLTGNRFDALGGGGANTLELSYAQGNINQGTLDAGENAAFGGTFSKLHYALSRQQTLTDSLSLYGALSGQTASKDLDTSERMYLGGATGVRAYPANEGGGSEGQLLNVELRQRLAGNFMLSGFYDWGHVNNGASVGPSYDLKGYGLGLGWISDAGASVKLVYSRRDGSNPNPSTSGNDQDGSLVRDRFWLSLTIPFGSSAESAPVASAAPAYGASVLAAPAPAPTPTPTPTAVAVPAGASDATPVLAATAPMPALAPAAPAAAVPVDSAPPAVATAEASSKDQSAAPTATELQAQMQAIQQTLSAWMQAWQRADVPAYLAFYDAGFQPAKGLSLAQWQAQRRQRLTHAGTIQISASAAHVVLKRESALVEFEQAYQSAHYHDKVHKVLQLRRSGAQWRIVSESASKD